MGTTNKKRASYAQEVLGAYSPKEPWDEVQSIKDIVVDLGHLLMEKGQSVEEAEDTILAALELFKGEVADDE